MQFRTAAITVAVAAAVAGVVYLLGVSYIQWGGGSLETENLSFEAATMQIPAVMPVEWRDKVINVDPEDIKFLGVRQCVVGRPAFHVYANAERTTFAVSVNPKSRGTRISFRPEWFYALTGFQTRFERRLVSKGHWDCCGGPFVPDFDNEVVERHVRASRVLITVPTPGEYGEWTQRLKEARVQVTEARRVRELKRGEEERILSEAEQATKRKQEEVQKQAEAERREREARAAAEQKADCLKPRKVSLILTP